MRASSNVNAQKLLGLALEHIPKVLEKVLLEDFKRARAVSPAQSALAH